MFIILNVHTFEGNILVILILEYFWYLAVVFIHFFEVRLHA